MIADVGGAFVCGHIHVSESVIVGIGLGLWLSFGKL